jgi:hypothetical protein
MSQQPTNEQLRVLDFFLKTITLSKTPEHLKKGILELKNQIQQPLEKYREQDLILILLNGGIEKKPDINDPNKGYELPRFPIRSEEKGSDEDFKNKLNKISEQKSNYREQALILSKEKADIKVPRIMTNEDFETFAFEIDALELEMIRDLLVKQPKE